MMASDLEELGDTLAFAVAALQRKIEDDVSQQGTQLRESLASHFAEAIAQCCCQLHSENSTLRQLVQRQGNTFGSNDCGSMDLRCIASDTSDATRKMNVYTNGCQSPTSAISNAERHAIPPLNLAAVTRDCNAPSTSISPSKDSEPADEILTTCSPQKTPISTKNTAESLGNDAPVARRTSAIYGLVSCSDRHSEKFSKGHLPTQGLRGVLARIVCSRFFDGTFNFLIVFNCLTMGLEAQQIVNGGFSDFWKEFLDTSEHLLTALFAIEISLKMNIFGCAAFSPITQGKMKDEHMWNFIDAFLVLFTGVGFMWIVPLISLLVGLDIENSMVKTLSVLRAIRLVRLVRVVRGVPIFHEAWLLLRGLSDSIRTLFWTCVVVTFITYIFAVFGMTLISKELADKRNSCDDDERRRELSELLEFVGGIDRLMYTLFQLLTLDSWNGIVRRIKREISWCWLFFYAYIAVAVFVLMNLVTAIIVDNAVAKSRHDEEDKLKHKARVENEELKKLEGLFKMMDTDGSGTLNWEEFKGSFEDPDIVNRWRLLNFDPQECKELFHLLDDGDGEIATHEFFEGLARMKGVAMSKDIFRVQKNLNILVEAHRQERGDSPLKRQVSPPLKREGTGQCAVVHMLTGGTGRFQELVKTRFNGLANSAALGVPFIPATSLLSSSPGHDRKEIRPWTPASKLAKPGEAYRSDASLSLKDLRREQTLE